jgi:hypothetical protein
MTRQANPQFKFQDRRKKQKVYFLGLRDRRRVNKVKIEDVLDKLFNCQGYRTKNKYAW